eukprot:m.109544 g.109544  ORF g.109544 m.109544 type:complete len:103 (-) comp13376_c0_seq2:2772-3080(-)
MPDTRQTNECTYVKELNKQLEAPSNNSSSEQNDRWSRSCLRWLHKNKSQIVFTPCFLQQYWSAFIGDSLLFTRRIYEAQAIAMLLIYLLKLPCHDFNDLLAG